MQFVNVSDSFVMEFDEEISSKVLKCFVGIKTNENCKQPLLANERPNIGLEKQQMTTSNLRNDTNSGIS